MKIENNIVREPVSIVAIGAGNRMNTYLHYVQQHRSAVTLAAVVEPDDIRRDAVARKFGLPADRCFKLADDYFQNPVSGVNAAFVCTPEDKHVKPTLQAIAAGYHVLLEKPIAQTVAECERIADAARQAGVVVGVCHVMRYHPYFMKIKEIVDSGELGKIISVEHSTGVGIDRFAHGFVRGCWRNSEVTNPLILAKCCHDVDFLLWLVGGKCQRVSSMGSLRWFKAENAPKGSAARCVDCKVEDKCPFSAIDLYKRRHEWIRNFDVPQGQTIDDVIDWQLREGPFGRCVYHCDNNVADNQTLIMQQSNGVDMTMTINVFTCKDDRFTRINLTEGEIVGDERTLTISHFRSRTSRTIDFSEVMKQPFHAGSDLSLVEAFVNTITGKQGGLVSTIDASIESHRICLEAERSRLTGVTVEL